MTSVRATCEIVRVATFTSTWTGVCTLFIRFVHRIYIYLKNLLFYILGISDDVFFSNHTTHTTVDKTFLPNVYDLLHLYLTIFCLNVTVRLVLAQYSLAVPNSCRKYHTYVHLFIVLKTIWLKKGLLVRIVYMYSIYLSVIVYR